MLDSFNREISYLRISVTDRCNLRCLYCMPEEGVVKRSHGECMSFEKITDTARAAVGLGIQKIRLTGGEPLVRKGIVTLVQMLSGIKGLELLTMTTNGHFLEQYARPLKEAGLTSLNISLDTLNPVRYRRLTRGGEISNVMKGIDSALSAGFPIKINMVITAETTREEMDEMKSFCTGKNMRLQRIREYSLKEDKFQDEEMIYNRPPPCSECNRIRLLSKGSIKPCLHTDQEIPLDPEDPVKALEEAIRNKPRCGSSCSTRNMVEIGG